MIANPKHIEWLEFPLFVKWQITGKCNLRCTHCYLTDYTKQGPLDKILSFIDYFVSKKVVGLVLLGGEPLVRRDLEQIVHAASSQGIRVKIATNATLVTPERASALVAAGARQFQVSLEGHAPELSDPVRGKGTFDRILLGARALRDAGAQVSMAFTISKHNAEHVTEIHRLVRDLGVRQLKLSAFVPIGTGEGLGTSFLLSRDLVLQVRKKLEELQSLYPEVLIDSAFLTKKEAACSNCTTTFGCGAGTTSLVVNNDFSLSACDILLEEDRTPPVHKPEDIAHVWKQHALFLKWRGLGPKDASSKSIADFSAVHQNKCHVAYSLYQQNLFA